MGHDKQVLLVLHWLVKSKQTEISSLCGEDVDFINLTLYVCYSLCTTFTKNKKYSLYTVGDDEQKLYGVYC